MVMPSAKGDSPCRYLTSHKRPAGYESGGPFILEHFHLTKGRLELREFIWKHWHDHIKGFAEAKAGTVDRGVVTVLYLIEPDAQGRWSIDVELDRPMDPPCVAFSADALIRVPIRNPNEEYPSQTLDLWLPEGRLPKERLPETSVVEPRLYRLLLVRDNKPLSDAI